MAKPRPHPTAETQAFWDGCAAGELRYQRCSTCGTAQSLPRPWCQQCEATTLEWQTAAGRGRLLSFTVVHRAPTVDWRDDVPYVIALVELDEGFRLMANVAGGEQAGLVPDAKVTIGFTVRDGVALPEIHLVR